MSLDEELVTLARLDPLKGGCRNFLGSAYPHHIVGADEKLSAPQLYINSSFC